MGADGRSGGSGPMQSYASPWTTLQGQEIFRPLDIGDMASAGIHARLLRGGLGLFPGDPLSYFGETIDR